MTAGRDNLRFADDAGVPDGLTGFPPEAPIISDKSTDEPSAFTPQGLLREARRQKGLPVGGVPAVCVLDPDGDLVRNLVGSGRAVRDASWACYHTDLHILDLGGLRLGLVGGAVGASFAVLVAEELFASGCRLLLSVTSAGRVAAPEGSASFVLIERALRDEGTSYHYLPPARYSEADPALVARAAAGLEVAGITVSRGSSWTTDAPFRETASAIASRRAEGILAVEMESAALYAFGRARDLPVLCFAHLTNQMARVEGDFEKGPQDGATEALALLFAVVAALRPVPSLPSNATGSAGPSVGHVTKETH